MVPDRNDPPEATLRALARKYLRLAAWRGQRDGGSSATRDELRALAAEFPGCLRELDLFVARTELEPIRERAGKFGWVFTHDAMLCPDCAKARRRGERWNQSDHTSESGQLRRLCQRTRLCAADESNRKRERFQRGRRVGLPRLARGV